MGRALAQLRESNIAIIGSGSASFHNLHSLASIGKSEFRDHNAEWSKAVNKAVEETDLAKREEIFRGWRSWPACNDMHPPSSGEHFMPLIVCAGAAGEDAAKKYADNAIGLQMYSYYWV